MESTPLAPGGRSLPPTALRSAFYSLLGFLAPIVLALATTPWILRRAGDFAYGLWMLALMVFGVAVLLDFGIGNATIRAIAACVERPGGAEDARRYFETATLTYVTVSVVAGAALLALAAPITALLAPATAGPQRAEALACVRAIGVAFPAVMLGNIVNAAFTGHRWYGAASLLNTARQAASTVVVVVILALGGDIPAVIHGTAGCSLLIALVGFWLVRARLLRFSLPPRFSRVHFRDLAVDGAFMFAQQALGTVRMQSGPVLMRNLAGPAALTPYSIGYTFASRIHSLTAVALNVMLPTVSALRAEGRGGEEALFYRRSQAFAAVIAGALAVPMAMLARPFLTLWLHDAARAASGHAVFTVLVVASYQMSLAVAPYYGLLGAGHARLAMAVEVAACGTAVAAGVFLIPRYGPLGAALAAVLSNVVLLPLLGALYESKARPLPGAAGEPAARGPGRWWHVPLRAGVSFALAAAATYPLVGLCGGWLPLIAVGAVSGVGSAVLFAAVVLSAEERRYAVDRLAARFRLAAPAAETSRP